MKEDAVSGPTLSAAELLAWVEKTSQNWKVLFEKYPEALALPCDVAGTKSVGELLQHIVAVELRFAEQLRDMAQTPYEQIPFGSVEEIYATHSRAMSKLRELVADSTYNWSQEIELSTRSLGNLKASRKTILFHALLHAIRHYAQLATLVRQHGIKPDWQMDYLLMGVQRA